MKEYPLLTAWQEGRLRNVWEQECIRLKRDDPKLLDSVARKYAGARVSAHISMEYEQLASTARHHARRNQSNPFYTDEIIEFYDALQSDELQSYRSILQDISGNPDIWADETGYLESIRHLPPEIIEVQMEAYEYGN